MPLHSGSRLTLAGNEPYYRPSGRLLTRCSSFAAGIGIDSSLHSLLVILALLAPVLLPTRWAPVVLLATTLLTFKAVLLLPVFWLTALLQDRRPPLRAYLPFFVACGLGLGLSWVLDSARFWQQGEDLLGPLFGFRWHANHLWLAMVSLVGAAVLKRGRGRHFPAAVGAGLWFFLLGQFLIHARPGWGLAGEHLVWTSLAFVAAGSLRLFLARRRSAAPRAWLWLGWTLVLTALFLWPFLHDAPPMPAGRLLAPAPMEISMARPQVGGLRFYDSELQREEFLRQEARHPGRQPLFVLMPEDPALPWLERTDSAGSLYLFHPERFPSPQFLFSSLEPRRRAGPCTGLFDDGVWTRAEFTLEFTLEKMAGEALEIRRRDWRPPQAGPLLPGMEVRLDGQPLALLQDQKTLTRWSVPMALRKPGAHRLTISAPTFVPAEVVPRATDRRALGVDLQEIVLR